METRYILDKLNQRLFIFGNTNNQKTVKELTTEQQAIVTAFQQLCDSLDVAPVITITMKKAIVYKTFIVIIGSNDKTVTTLLTDLTTAEVNIFNQLLALLGASVEKVEYTKATNIISIDGVEQVASTLNQTPLLDEIEAICVELLNT